MTTTTMLWLLTALAVKHFIVDFPLQAFPYQYKNKGTYLHPGGILHSGLHMIATFGILVWFIRDVPTALMLSAIEFLAHYHIDWAKMNVNAKMGWTPDNSEKFWALLGFDQLLHTLTYLWIVWMLVG